jgi:hypothetical protein
LAASTAEALGCATCDIDITYGNPGSPATALKAECREIIKEVGVCSADPDIVSHCAHQSGLRLLLQSDGFTP